MVANSGEGGGSMGDNQKRRSDRNPLYPRNHFGRVSDYYFAIPVYMAKLQRYRAFCMGFYKEHCTERNSIGQRYDIVVPVSDREHSFVGLVCGIVRDQHGMDGGDRIHFEQAVGREAGSLFRSEHD